jgi:ribosome-associated translation inhibitor RaiA
MATTPTQSGLKVTFDVHEYHLAGTEEQMLRDNLDGLARQVAHFPVADLHVLVQGNARSNDVTVKLTLVLPGTTLVTSARDAVPRPAFDQALDSLLNSLREHKDKLGRVPARKKAQEKTQKDVFPTVVIDPGAIEASVSAGDYAAFRAATLSYDEELRMRIGRLVQRHPDFDAEIGSRVEIADVLEEVFLMAFDQYRDRHADVPFGTWLEELVDPAIKALQQHHDEEMENIAMARTECGAVEGRERT